MSSISIIGLGNMAGALAGRALAGGNAVEIIGRDPAKAKELAAALGGATVGAPGAAPAGGIVILAVPYGSAAAVVSEYGDALRGKVIVDITNPINADFTGFVTPEGSSGAQEIARAAPAGAHVVKAFNALFSNVLAAGPAGGRALDVFIAGDDAPAKTRVSAFIESLGLRPLDTGLLPMARALENVGLLQLGLLTHSVKHTDFFVGVTILKLKDNSMRGFVSGGTDAVAATELPVILAYGEALAGTGKPLVGLAERGVRSSIVRIRTTAHSATDRAGWVRPSWTRRGSGPGGGR